MAGPREQIFVAQPLAYAGQRVIASPFQFATTEDDNLQIVSANSLPGVVLAIHGRRLTTAGAIEPFAFVHVPNSDRSTKTENYKLGAGSLLNLVIFASSGAPRIGQTYVSARIIRGLSSVTVILGALLGGYVTAAQSLAYPGSPIESSIAGGGYIRAFVGTDPPAGADMVETVPTGARWQLIAFTATLLTSAVAATRRPHLQFALTAGTSVRIANPGTSIAATNIRYHWSVGLPFDTLVSLNAPTTGIPTEPFLLAGDGVQTATENFDPGDNWGAPVVTVREWLEVQS